MKRLDVLPDLFAAVQARDVLQGEGIPCSIQSDIPSFLFPRSPIAESTPTLWVENDADLSLALATLRELQQTPPLAGLPWKCPRCTEQMETQFTSCWKCGQDRPTAF